MTKLTALSGQVDLVGWLVSEVVPADWFVQTAQQGADGFAFASHASLWSSDNRPNMKPVLSASLLDPKTRFRIQIEHAVASRPDRAQAVKATHAATQHDEWFRAQVAQGLAEAESLFRTAKYRPEFPAKSFASLDEARAWASEFVRWYNVDHRHSAIGYVCPQQRHTGDDHAILAARHALYTQAQQRNPARWSGHTRDWSHISVVTLNPARDMAVSLPARASHTQRKAA